MHRSRYFLLAERLIFARQGSVLDDPSLVEVLNANKRIAIEVKEKVSIAEDTKMKIGAAREEYRPVAVRGSIIYFLMSEIAVDFSFTTVRIDEPWSLFLWDLARQSYVSNLLTTVPRSLSGIDAEVLFSTSIVTHSSVVFTADR